MTKKPYEPPRIVADVKTKAVHWMPLPIVFGWGFRRFLFLDWDLAIEEALFLDKLKDPK